MRNILIFGLVLVVLLAGCAQQPPQGTAGAGNNGNVVVTVADKAADMGAVTSIKVSIDSVMVESATNGWVTVSSTPVTVDLLQLKASGNQMLLANVPLANGSYNQVRLEVSNVVVTDSSGDHQAKLPSGDLKIVGGFDVVNNTVSVVKFDFEADKSLHVTGDGRYIFAPVIHLQTLEGANVDTNDSTNVKVNGGLIKTDTEVGMDENGTVGVGLGISPNADITIDSGGNVRIGLPGSDGHGNPHDNQTGTIVNVSIGS